ncbi:MAG TPA: BON domain-containing protein, partial [Croceicoccus sp.]|nr:BON domain-containing protein [Croceicoccus sp.]
DEIASWFGDDAATRRREQDHRGAGPQNYTRSDQRILDDICDRLTEDRYVDASDITVTVQEREVTLDGSVTSKQAKRRAEDVADHVTGVGHVQNNLSVKDRQKTEERQTL